MRRTLSLIVGLALVLPTTLLAQVRSTDSGPSNDYWRTYTARLPIGSVVKVRTSDGQRMNAVLAIVDDSGITVQPKTRVPEPPRVIPFEQLRQVELTGTGGSNVGRAIGIGVGVGAASFLGLLALLAASWD